MTQPRTPADPAPESAHHRQLRNSPMTTCPPEHSITRNYQGGSPTDPHTWGAFPGLAIELGGYSDIELVIPGSGDRFWYLPGNTQDPTDPDWFAKSAAAAILKAAEVGFFRPAG